jgi:hypothetical protein
MQVTTPASLTSELSRCPEKVLTGKRRPMGVPQFSFDVWFRPKAFESERLYERLVRWRSNATCRRAGNVVMPL